MPGVIAPSPLHVVSTGTGDPPVVLVHGFGAYGHFWRKWVPHLSSRHRTISVDLMGFGKAEAPRDADYSPEGHAHPLAEMVRGLDRPPVLVGHSIGAGIALLTALELGSSLSPPLAGLVLVSPAVYPQRFPPYIRLLRIPLIGELFLLAPPPSGALARGIRGIVKDPTCVDAELVAGYRAPLMDRARRRAILRSARQLDLAGGRRLAARLREIRLPTLLIWGDQDPVVSPLLADQLSRDLGGAELVRLPGVGHLPPEEAPERSVEPVLRFLSRLAANS